MRKFSAILFTALFVFLMVPAYCFPFSTAGGGHLTITQDAVSIMKQKKMHEDVFKQWIEKAMEEGNAGNFLTGVYDEDCTTKNKTAMQELPIPGSTSPTGPNGWGGARNTSMPTTLRAAM